MARWLAVVAAGLILALGSTPAIAASASVWVPPDVNLIESPAPGVEIVQGGLPVTSPTADFLNALDVAMAAGGLPEVGSMFAGLGLHRWWWLDNLEVDFYGPGTTSLDFDIYFTMKAPGGAMGLGCAIGLPLPQSGGPGITLITTDTWTQCFEAPVELLELPGTDLMLSNEQFLDALFPLSWGQVSGQSAGPGTTVYDCSQLRANSPAGRFAALTGAGGAAAG